MAAGCLPKLVNFRSVGRVLDRLPGGSAGDREALGVHLEERPQHVKGWDRDG